jgi:hypothetical protein
MDTQPIGSNTVVLKNVLQQATRKPSLVGLFQWLPCFITKGGNKYRDPWLSFPSPQSVPPLLC